jgi:hypothetical protein
MAVGGHESFVGTAVSEIGSRMPNEGVAGGGPAGWLAWIAEPGSMAMDEVNGDIEQRWLL